MGAIKVVGLDLDGTVTAAKSQIEEKNKHILALLTKKYRVVIAGAGYYERILSQIDAMPVDIIGNYGMQYAEYSKDEGRHILLKNDKAGINRQDVIDRAERIYSHFHLESVTGDKVQFYPSGCFTVALLGTMAEKEDKAVFDPKRELRRRMHSYVSELFPEYTVFIGGETSFDMAPKGYDKLRAIREYCARHGIALDSLVFAGDDYGQHGNDESLYKSNIRFIKIADYRELESKLSFLL